MAEDRKPMGPIDRHGTAGCVTFFGGMALGGLLLLLEVKPITVMLVAGLSFAAAVVCFGALAPSERPWWRRVIDIVFWTMS